MGGRVPHNTQEIISNTQQHISVNTQSAKGIHGDDQRGSDPMVNDNASCTMHERTSQSIKYGEKTTVN